MGMVSRGNNNKRAFRFLFRIICQRDLMIVFAIAILFPNFVQSSMLINVQSLTLYHILYYITYFSQQESLILISQSSCSKLQTLFFCVSMYLFLSLASKLFFAWSVSCRVHWVILFSQRSYHHIFMVQQLHKLDWIALFIQCIHIHYT